ncbi:DUF443 family protein [Oceanobacillus iheyensis]|uniref:DUF443 family protein n=1 Tax=Oceanobacillus iheyensis TaxID=182710 RepID=UPI003635A4BE
MSSEVNIILKNLRYNLIKADNEYYIIDKDQPFLINFLLPFLYWIFPKKVTKISAATAEQIQTVSNKEAPTSKVSYIGIGISVILTNLIGPLLDYLDVDITPFIAYSILFLITLLLVLFRVIVSNKFKHSLFQQLHLSPNQADETLWVTPRRVKNIASLLFLTIFIWAFVVGGLVSFFLYGNLFMLFVFTLAFFILLFLNILCVTPGKDTMKIRFKK